MIEVIVSENEQNKDKLLVDGVIITKELGSIFSTMNKNYWASIYDYSISEKIVEVTFNEIPKEIQRLSLYYPLYFTEYIENIKICRDPNKTAFTELRFEFSWDFEEWKNQFSIKEFAKAFKEITLEYKEEIVEWQEEDEFISNGCSLVFSAFNRNDKLKIEIEKKIIILKEIFERVDNLLLTASKEESVVNLFDFPEHVRVPCEQYLVYFSQFLRNIGIDATTDISHSSGKVLFSVTPVSEKVALYKISEALDIYLQLPNNFDDNTFIDIYQSAQEQQLAATIQHFKSQIMYSNLVIQTQTEKIQNQRDFIEQQKKLIDTTVLQQSLINNATDSTDEEEILGGSVSLTSIDVKGFKINIPTIYRWLQDNIKKK